MDPLNLEVATLEAVPPEFRKCYVPKEDGTGFKTSEDYLGVVNTVNGLNKALGASREEAKKGKVDLSPLAEFGGTPAEIKENILAKIAELEGKAKQTPDQKAQLESLRLQLQDSFGKEKEKLGKQAETLRGQLYTHLVENQALSAIAEAKGIPELLLPVIKAAVRTEEADDGKLVVRVLGADGQPRYNIDGSFMTVKGLVEELKADTKYGRVFESERQQGGAGTQQNSTRKPGPAPKTTLSATDKISAGLAQGGYKRTGGFSSPNK